MFWIDDDGFFRNMVMGDVAVAIILEKFSFYLSCLLILYSLLDVLQFNIPCYIYNNGYNFPIIFIEVCALIFV